MVLLDTLLVAGAAWMVQQVQTGSWNTPDPAATITEITRTAGGALGIVTALTAGGVCGASAAGGLRGLGSGPRRLPVRR